MDDSYRGPLSATRRETVLFSFPSGAEAPVEVVRVVNTHSDPRLARALLSDELNLAVCPKTGEKHEVAVSVIFHDPLERLLVLVLPDADRHRELSARAELFAELARATSHPVPAYVRKLDAVFGSNGLRGVLAAREVERDDRRGRDDLEVLRSKLGSRARELDGRADQLKAFEEELGRLEADLELREQALAAAEEDLTRRLEQLEELEEASDDDEGMTAERQRPTEPGPYSFKPSDTSPSLAPPPANTGAASAADRAGPRAETDAEPARPPRAEPRAESEGSSTTPFDRISDSELDLEAIEPEEIVDDEVVVADQLVEGEIVPDMTEPGVEGATRVGGQLDVLIERWIASREPSLAAVDEQGRVRVALATGSETLEGLLSNDLKVMLQLHRLPTYPLVTLSIGTRDGFASGRPQPATLFFDIDDDGDRAVLSELSNDFTFQVDLFDTEYLPVRKRTITAGLAANVQYVINAADAARDAISPNERSLSRALIAYDDPSYDRFGREHPERKEFREDVLGDLARPSRVRWALHVCRRFSTPEGEEYLFLIRGYPLRLWHKRRREVLERAVELGLWSGNTLSRIAMSEGVAESRTELARMLAQSFVKLVEDDGGVNDLDQDAVRDNWSALTEELRKVGLDPDKLMGPRTEPIDSARMPEASGTIGQVNPLHAMEYDQKPVEIEADEPSTLAGRSVDELLGLLGDRDLRYAAAIELCRHRHPSTVRPLFTALRRMTRAEAGHIFGNLVGFGEQTIPHLIETLGSRKGFLRQGAALALSALKADDGLEPVCDLLLSEPTDIWKEVARAVGEYGPRAVMPLAARLRDQPEGMRERVAWALAHVASRGDRTPIDTLAGGRDPVAAGVARHALELADLARSDNRSIWNPRAGREHTVKRAFSRRVLEALPGAQQHRKPSESGDISGPAMMLSEADLLEAGDIDDDIEPLDESDLMPT
jgi:hypothetical protein